MIIGPLVSSRARVALRRKGNSASEPGWESHGSRRYHQTATTRALYHKFYEVPLWRRGFTMHRHDAPGKRSAVRVYELERIKCRRRMRKESTGMEWRAASLSNFYNSAIWLATSVRLTITTWISDREQRSQKRLKELSTAVYQPETRHPLGYLYYSAL